MSMGVKPPEKMADRVQPCVDDCNEFLGGWEAGFSRVGRNKETDRILLAKSPGLPRRATIGCDNPPLPKRSCSFVAVSAMNEQAIDFANSIRSFLIHTLNSTLAVTRHSRAYPSGVRTARWGFSRAPCLIWIW